MLENDLSELIDFNKRGFSKVVRAALEKLFYIWLRKYAKKRFERGAINRYENLKRSYKRGYSGQREYDDKYLRMLAARIAKGNDTPDPLVSTGNLRERFVHGSYRFTGSVKYGSLRVTWVNLPKAATKRKAGKKTMDINIPEALTEITSQEEKELSDLFMKILQKELDRTNHRKTYGRAVINI